MPSPSHGGVADGLPSQTHASVENYSVDRSGAQDPHSGAVLGSQAHTPALSCRGTGPHQQGSLWASGLKPCHPDGSPRILAPSVLPYQLVEAPRGGWACSLLTTTHGCPAGRQNTIETETPFSPSDFWATHSCPQRGRQRKGRSGLHCGSLEEIRLPGADPIPPGPRESSHKASPRPSLRLTHRTATAGRSTVGSGQGSQQGH